MFLFLCFRSLDVRLLSIYLRFSQDLMTNKKFWFWAISKYVNKKSSLIDLQDFLRSDFPNY
ncbi:CLUMA_CG001966, isoform A [Clunio marinus]|uniref:CLUMA_CG001966, isoform A n=1 Tax=Clunio marinus TaxID=568069 RepID=A0A1J1HJI2_9DIPT|nr:CLUMA_CG001966, isoform A [Clunio marinus]